MKRKELKEIPGVMVCILEHEVTSTEVQFSWTGPKITRALWHQLLTLLIKNYNDTHSEAQARLYLNVSAGMWGVYPHPQIVGTGMSSKTLDIKETQEEVVARCTMMGDPEPSHWEYWGTVHDHCNSTAFQSGVDEQDEASYGLHITMGGLGSTKLSLHCRLYVSGVKITPNLSDFWDVGVDLNSLPPQIRNLITGQSLHELAISQMCEPPPAGIDIPGKWLENLIKKQVEKPKYLTPLPWQTWDSHAPHGTYKPNITYWADAAVKEIKAMFNGEDLETIINTLKEADAELGLSEIMKICDQNRMGFDELIDELEKAFILEETPKAETADGKLPAAKEDDEDKWSGYH